MDRYATYREALISQGISEEEADAVIEENKREDACLDRLECPRCGGKLEVRVSESQAGPSQVPGAWHSYRCHTCKHMVDRKEARG